MDDSFYGMRVPGHIRDQLKAYVEQYRPTDSFLRAVISNDLREAVAQADPVCIVNIPAIVNWLYWNPSGECWGSPEKYKEWIEKGSGYMKGQI